MGCQVFAVDGNHKLGKATRDASTKGWVIAYNERHMPVIAFATDMPESVRSYAGDLKQCGRRCELHGKPVFFRMAVPWLTTGNLPVHTSAKSCIRGGAGGLYRQYGRARGEAVEGGFPDGAAF